MYNQGNKQFNDLTNAEQDRLITEMGTSILTSEQYVQRKDDSRRMFSFRKGNKTFYTYMFKDATFLNDKSTVMRNVFSFVPLSESSKVQVGLSTEEVTIKTIEELKERIDTALEVEDYRLVQVL